METHYARLRAIYEFLVDLELSYFEAEQARRSFNAGADALRARVKTAKGGELSILSATLATISEKACAAERLCLIYSNNIQFYQARLKELARQ